jgi:hypothetical protein
VTDQLIPAHEWHPLDGVPAPEYIPRNWDGMHVGKRLIEGFRTLARVPLDWGPKHYGTAWPAYRLEHREWFAALVDAENPTPIVAARNRTRLAPAAIEITRMEIVIGWPGRYLSADLSRVVQHVARYRALDWATEDIARKLGLSPSHLRRCNRMGLDQIARALHTERVAVF